MRSRVEIGYPAATSQCQLKSTRSLRLISLLVLLSLRTHAGIEPAAAAELAVGDLVLVDPFHERVLQLDPLTGVRTEIAVVDSPISALVEAPGTILVGRTPQWSGQSSVIRVDPDDGSVSDPLGSKFTIEATGMAFDAQGKLLVVTSGYSGGHVLSRIDLDNKGVVVVADLGSLSAPLRIAVEQGGSVLVTDGANPGAVARVDVATGSVSLLAAGGWLQYPMGIALAANGDVYVTSVDPSMDEFLGRIVRIDPITGAQEVLSEGGLLWDLTALALGTDGSLFTEASPLGALENIVAVNPLSGAQTAVSTGDSTGPVINDIAVVEVVTPPDPVQVTLNRGDVVATSPLDQEVVHIDRETGAWSPLAAIPRVSPPGDEYVFSLLVEPSGALLVGTRAREPGDPSSVVRIDLDNGTITDPVSGAFLLEATAMVFDLDGRVIVGSAEEAIISRIDLETASVSTISQGGLLEGPWAIAIEASGAIVVLDALDGGTVLRIDPATGNQSVVSTGNLLIVPRAIAVAADGSIYVTALGTVDGLDGRVLRIDPLTGEQEVFAEGGLLREPWALELDRDGALLVSSGGDTPFLQQRVVRIDPSTGIQTALVGDAIGHAPQLSDMVVLERFSCPPVPDPSCAAGGRAAITMKAATNGDNGKLAWKWTRGSIALAELGDPLLDSDYALCAYVDEVNVSDSPIEAGGSCGNRPCWTALGTKGFKYRDQSGIISCKLLSGTDNATIRVKGGRGNLSLPELPISGTEVRVQLVQSDGGCWESTFAAFDRNDEKVFKAATP